jgi:ABC-type multidrug transport system ATPase subunit
MKLLMGLLRADSGEARLFGSPLGQAGPDVAIRRRIGFVTEDLKVVRAQEY